MDEEYQKKLNEAKIAYALIISAMEGIKRVSSYEIDFCWDECIWIDDILFQYDDMKNDDKI